MDERSELREGTLSGLAARKHGVAEIRVYVRVGEHLGKNVHHRNRGRVLGGQRQRVVERQLGIIGEVDRA